MIRIILLCTLIGLLTSISGCGGGTSIQVVVPPDYLLIEIESRQPPAVENYLKLDTSDKEDLLVSIYRDQTNFLNMCNTQLRSIKSWKIKQLEKFKEYSEE